MDWIFPLVLLCIVITGVLLLKFAWKKQQEEVPLPYKAKQYLFSRSEHEFLRILHEHIDTNRYLIFPKVRLADFVVVTARGTEYQGWWNKIRSKHVDFLIWDVERNAIALAIELDGKSHNSTKAQERDDFVNRLYERIEVPLERVSVGSDFQSATKRIVAELQVPQTNQSESGI